MSELSLVVTLNRVRAEREEAFQRASIFAREVDRLQTALLRITECPCCEQFSCAEFAADALSSNTAIFNREWKELEDARQQV